MVCLFVLFVLALYTWYQVYQVYVFVFVTVVSFCAFFFFFRQGTIKSRLLSMTYTTPEVFASDVRLVFNNAISFNPESHFVHTWAVQLLNEFDVSRSPM